MAITSTTAEQAKRIAAAQAAYQAAGADKTLTQEQRTAAQTAAHDEAEAVRKESGYSGGYNGAQVQDLNPQQPEVAQPEAQQYQDQSKNISSSYDAQLAAQLAQLRGARDQANSDYQGQIDSAPQTYQPQRDKVDVGTARTLQTANEVAAAKGTAFTGGVASDQSATRVGGENAKVALTQQEMNFVQNLKKAIADNNKATSYQEVAATATSTAQKNQALTEEARNVYANNAQAAQNTFTNNLALQDQALQTKSVESQLKTADSAQAGQLIQNELSQIALDIQKNPNSPENKARAIALEKAQLELDAAKINAKYTERERKAALDSIFANIRQSDASAAASSRNAQTNADQLAWQKDPNNPANLKDTSAAEAAARKEDKDLYDTVYKQAWDMLQIMKNGVDPMSGNPIDVNRYNVKEVSRNIDGSDLSDTAAYQMKVRLGLPIIP